MVYYTYILASRTGRALYVGVTRDLRRRVEEHRSGQGSVHTAKYNIHRLVYFETHAGLEQAILRERKLKRWKRRWKNDLIRLQNPNWLDLVMEIPL